MKLDKKYLLGKGQGMEIAIHSLSVSRAHIAASNLGMCQRMLEMSLARANDRITFGKPIASRQMIKREIAEMQMYTHALRCMVYDFGREYDADPNGKYIEEKAAYTKLFSIYSPVRSDGMLRSSVATATFEDSPTARPSASTATLAPCGSKRVLPTFSASPLPATAVEVRRQAMSTSCNHPLKASIAQEQIHL